MPIDLSIVLVLSVLYLLSAWYYVFPVLNWELFMFVAEDPHNVIELLRTCLQPHDFALSEPLVIVFSILCDTCSFPSM